MIVSHYNYYIWANAFFIVQLIQSMLFVIITLLFTSSRSHIWYEAGSNEECQGVYCSVQVTKPS